MEIKSIQKYYIGSPKKIREVLPLIKKMKPRQAYDALPFSGRRAGEVLRKVIGSALANAKQKGAKEEELIFKEIQVNEGPRLKRFRAGARGMAKPYRKKLSHIRVVLATVKIPDSGVEVKEKTVELKKEGKEKGEPKASLHK